MRCCGKNRNTRYCSECGKRLQREDVLYDILDHFRAELNKHRRRKERIENKLTEPYPNEEERLKIWIAKWESWEKAIISAIEAKKKKT